MKNISTGYELNVELHETLRQAAIHFNLSESSEVLLRVMNTDDKEVRLLINENMPAGKHSAFFSFGNLHPDEYIIRLLVNSKDAVDIETVNIKIL
jgi:hypothetical protein